MKKLLLLATLGATVAASAQVFVPIRRADSDWETFVAGGASAVRVGARAAIATIVSKSRTAGHGGYASSYLVACDGSWLSGPLRTSFAEQGADFPAGHFRQFLDERDDAPNRAAPQRQAYEGELFWPGVRALMPSICKTAAAPDKKEVYAFASSISKAQSSGSARAMLVGTAEKKGNVVEIWMRDTDFKLEPIVIGGEPFKVDGEVQYSRKNTGSFSMTKNIIDCARRTLGAVQIADYAANDSRPSVRSVPREKVELEEPIPSSIGEATVEAVCRLWG